MRIILASRSPARRLLMKELNIPFECHTSDYEEDMNRFKTAPALSKFLALQKALYIANKYPNAIIIGADTIGTIKKRIVGKPPTIKAATVLLQSMSGKKVKVHTGLATILTDKQGKIAQKITSHTVTTLTFSKLTPQNIKDIIKEDDVLNVAGALTIEGESGKYVKTIQGDFQNVMGLPVFQLKEMLNKLGIKLN